MAKKNASFDEMIAASAKPAAKKTAKKKAASYVSVPKKIASAIKSYLECKREMKAIKSDMSMHEGILLEHFQNHHDTEAFNGKFAKSHKFSADDDNVINFVTANKFSIATEDAGIIEEICSEHGVDPSDMIEKKYTVKLKDEVFENDELKKKLMKLVGDKFGEFFETTVSVETSEKFDEKMYELGEDGLADLRTYAKQKKPSLR